jgi:hypothetical protein
MRKIMTGLFAMALAFPLLAFAQNGITHNEQQQYQKNTQADENQAASVAVTGQTTMPNHHMTAMVSNDGKNLTSDNTTYVVDNPKKLKNYDNQNVMVKFDFNTDNNTVHVLSVSPAQ